jgi:TolB-like protein/lipoprotein NlpI
MTLFAELKRRNVLRVGAAYVVVAWLVIQVVETIFPAFGFGDVAVRNTTIVFAIGFIPALIFAWAFELTPEGLKKESEVDRSQSVTPHTGKKLDRMIMVVLALGLALFAFDKFVLDPQREAAKDEQVADKVEQAKQQGRTEALVESYGDKSIAVLPFVNMSSDEEQEYFSDGISEELLNLLAKIPDLRVISRSSAFSFKGQNLEIPEIAQRLNVAHILEGSVRKSGKKIRITAQLIEAHSDTHLWSETYDRELDDIFAIQDEISATVVAQLKITLLGEAPHVEQTDPEAYALHLQARHLGRLGTAEGHEQSIALFEQALAIDPEYAGALVGLAANYINMAGFDLLPWDEGFAKAREATEKALAIDPDHAPAHGMLGWIAMGYDNDLAQAARHFDRALQLDPNNIYIISNASGPLFNLGRVDECIAIREYVAARDPVNPSAHFNLAMTYRSAGRWDEAIASYETGLRLSPGAVGAHDYFMGEALLFKDEAEAALEAFEQESDERYRVKGQAIALYALGSQEEHQAKLDELIERWGDQLPSDVAHVYAYMGDTDRAFEWLQKSVDEGGFNPADPLLQPLADDRRWLPLLESIGKSPEQLAAIKFEVKLPAQ